MGCESWQDQVGKVGRNPQFSRTPAADLAESLLDSEIQTKCPSLNVVPLVGTEYLLSVTYRIGVSCQVP